MKEFYDNIIWDIRGKMSYGVGITPATKTSRGEIHGCNLQMYLKGPEAVLQFVIYTNWHLPYVQDQVDARSPSKMSPYMFHTPMPFDRGCHSINPQYDGHTPMDYKCHLLSTDCYYDGSSLNAIDLMNVLRCKGMNGVWEELEAEYEERWPS